jgi:hypothetical protein
MVSNETCRENGLGQSGGRSVGFDEPPISAAEPNMRVRYPPCEGVFMRLAENKVGWGLLNHIAFSRAPYPIPRFAKFSL